MIKYVKINLRIFQNLNICEQYPLRLNGANTVPVIKWPQWSHGKTLSHNAMSFFKIFSLFFTAFFEKV